jgi:hypothetical protein
MTDARVSLAPTVALKLEAARSDENCTGARSPFG